MSRRCNKMKDSTVSARVENDVKNEAEDILQKLGSLIPCTARSFIVMAFRSHWLFRQSQEHWMRCRIRSLTQNFSTAMRSRSPVKEGRLEMYSMIWKGSHYSKSAMRSNTGCPDSFLFLFWQHRWCALWGREWSDQRTAEGISRCLFRKSARYGFQPVYGWDRRIYKG